MGRELTIELMGTGFLACDSKSLHHLVNKRILEPILKFVFRQIGSQVFEGPCTFLNTQGVTYVMFDFSLILYKEINVRFGSVNFEEG